MIDTQLMMKMITAGEFCTKVPNAATVFSRITLLYGNCNCSRNNSSTFEFIHHVRDCVSVFKRLIET